jgi:chemotaxis response regulator CheB
MNNLESAIKSKFDNIKGKRKTRIYIISTHLMFGHGLESLLHKESDLEVIGQEMEIERAIEAIKKLEPDVVILDTEGLSYGSVRELMAILKAASIVRVITLNLHNNTLHVYRAKRQIAKGTEDIIQAIKEDLFKNKEKRRTKTNGYSSLMLDGQNVR